MKTEYPPHTEIHLPSTLLKSEEQGKLAPAEQHPLHTGRRVTLSPVNPADFERVRFNRLNEEYEPLINLAKLFIENMSLELQGSRFRTFSLLFDMNILFEEFVGEFLVNRSNSATQEILS